MLPGIVARRPGWGVVSRLLEKPTHGGLSHNCGHDVDYEEKDVDHDSETDGDDDDRYLGVKVFFRFTSLGPLHPSFYTQLHSQLTRFVNKLCLRFSFFFI